MAKVGFLELCSPGWCDWSCYEFGEEFGGESPPASREEGCHVSKRRGDA
jgi:hypothetical protein